MQAAGKRHTTTILPLRRREWSLELGVMVVSVYGYRWRCKCGELGPVCSTWESSRSGAAAHRRTGEG